MQRAGFRERAADEGARLEVREQAVQQEARADVRGAHEDLLPHARLRSPHAGREFAKLQRAGNWYEGRPVLMGCDVAATGLERDPKPRRNVEGRTAGARGLSNSRNCQIPHLASQIKRAI